MITGTRTTLVSLWVVLSLLLAGCAQGPASQASTPSAQSPAKAGASPEARSSAPSPTPRPGGDQARYGGALTVSSVADPASLDTHQEVAINTSMVVAPAYNLLVEYQPLKGKGIYPGLAESWEMSKDGLTYTFNMRKGVKFHDGSPLTPEDAAFSVSRLWKPPQGVRTVVAGLMDAVNGVTAAGDQVKVTVDYPYGPLLPILAYSNAVVYPKRVVEANGDMKKTVVGTGPFRFKSYTPGVSIDLAKNPDYWVPERPYLNSVSFLILKDSMTRLAGLRTGRIKMTGRGFATLSPTEMETIKKENRPLVFYPSASPLYPGFFMNIRNKPFNDKRVRQAISLAIDRQAAFKALAQDQGMIGRIFPAEGWGISDDERGKFPGYRQPKDPDIAEAKRLMSEAGYPSGFKLTILARSMVVSKDSAVFMTGQLSKLGIEARVEVVEDAVFWDRGNKAQHEAMVYTPTMSVVDVENLARYFVKGGSLNYSGNDSDQALNDLWQKQRRTLDESQRKAVIADVERHILEEAQPFIPLVVPFTFITLWSEVKNFAPGPSEYGNNNLQEIWLGS